MNKIKKKKKLDEGIILLSTLRPVATFNNLKLTSHGPDNFVFKGLPGQFDEDGNKVLDEMGNKIITEVFTKKHYVMIADVLKKTKTIKEVANQFAEMFKEDNPLFKKDFFLKASGVKGDLK